MGSGTTLVFSNEETDNIIKIVKSLEDAGLLIRSVSEAVGNEGFLGMATATLGASLLRNMLTGKGVIRAGEGAITADQDF